MKINLTFIWALIIFALFSSISCASININEERYSDKLDQEWIRIETCTKVSYYVPEFTIDDIGNLHATKYKRPNNAFSYHQVIEKELIISSGCYIIKR